MVTIYDLLEVDEKASKSEIEEAYRKLIKEYRKDSKLTEQENSENEIILNKLKIAYDILMNEEKRKKYDNDLAKKRAEELIKNISINNSECKNKLSNETNNNPTEKNEFYTVNESPKVVDKNNKNFNNDELTKEEQKKIRKAAQNEFKNNLKKAQKAEEEYNQAYNEAYNAYLRKMGYNVKEPWTLKRVKNLVITILAIILVCALAWIIPPIRALLISIYEENFIVKSLVDIVRILMKPLTDIFK